MALFNKKPEKVPPAKKEDLESVDPPNKAWNAFHVTHRKQSKVNTL